MRRVLGHGFRRAGQIAPGDEIGPGSALPVKQAGQQRPAGLHATNERPKC